MKSEIILNRTNYPLCVEGSLAEEFRDWDGKGSSVLLEARVISDGGRENRISFCQDLIEVRQ